MLSKFNKASVHIAAGDVVAVFQLGESVMSCMCEWLGGRDVTRSTEGPGEEHRSSDSTCDGWKYVKFNFMFAYFGF